MYCRLCKSTRFQQRFKKEGIPYCECLQCGFTFSWPDTNANLSNRLEDFEPAYLNYLDASTQEVENFSALLSRIVQQAGKLPNSVLDIGAGGGKWVRFLRSRGIEAIGVEPSKALFDRFLKHDAFFHNCFADELAMTLDGKKFEVVTAFDVLEHIEDPAHFLASISNNLDQQGWLFVSTPDVNSIFASVFRSKWHFYNRYHLSYFNRETLNKSCLQHNLVLKTLRHIGRKQSLGYVAEYFFHFILKMRFLRSPRFLHQVYLSINFHDTFFAALQKMR